MTLNNRHVARSLSALLATAGLLLFASLANAQESSVEQILRLKKAVVVVTTFDSHGMPLLQGSGFFIDADQVATNFHVIKNASRIRVETFNRVSSTATSVLAVDEKSDLALLRLESPLPQSTILTLKTKPPAEGDAITVISNPQGSRWKVTRGSTGLLWEFHGMGERLQITASVLPGSSGGPVLDAGGEVVGIASMYFNSIENLSFAVPVERLQALQLKAQNVQARLTSFGN
jgi:S1-C subfamily serine protease